MCGRYTASWSKAQFEKTFNVQPPLFEGNTFESYNIAPTTQAPIVRLSKGKREASLAKWGLIPKWVDKPLDFKANMFNARSETILEKASFKRPFKSQRCLVPVSGFYEWRGKAGSKQPYHIRLGEDEPFALAGVWDYWEKGDASITSYTIITTEANEQMQDIHHRMPVILPTERFEDWLEPDSEPEMLTHFLEPFNGELDIYQVDKRVGSVRNNDAELVAPLNSK